MAPKRAEKATAYYARVSSKTQDMRSQIPDLEAHARAQSGPIRWYKDAFTGMEMERPGSEQLMAPGSTRPYNGRARQSARRAARAEGRACFVARRDA
jgi:predicted site-specific integrase-resolvase